MNDEKWGEVGRVFVVKKAGAAHWVRVMVAH